MKYYTALAVACFALLSSACTTYHINDGPQLQDLSNIPAPRTGGLSVYFAGARDLDSKRIKSTMMNSGYFSKIDFSGKYPDKKQAYISVRHYLSGKYTPSWAWSKLASLFTIGIIPTFYGASESWSVKLMAADGSEVDSLYYRYEGRVTTSIWPYVLLLGATKGRSEGERYARFTSNLIYDLNKNGFLNK